MPSYNQEASWGGWAFSHNSLDHSTLVLLTHQGCTGLIELSSTSLPQVDSYKQ